MPQHRPFSLHLLFVSRADQLVSWRRWVAPIFWDRSRQSSEGWWAGSPCPGGPRLVGTERTSLPWFGEFLLRLVTCDMILQLEHFHRFDRAWYSWHRPAPVTECIAPIRPSPPRRTWDVRPPERRETTTASCQAPCSRESSRATMKSLHLARSRHADAARSTPPWTRWLSTRSAHCHWRKCSRWRPTNRLSC